MSTVVYFPSLSTPALPGCAIEIYESMSDWLDARDQVIGASESPSIFGVGYADESPMSVWARKRGHMSEKPDTEALECGRVLQPAILELFSRRSGLRVQSLGEFTLCKSIAHPWLGASLDGVVVETDEGPAVVEAKNVGVFMSHEWNDDDQPLKFQVQVQQQMAVAGVDRAFTVGLIGGNRLRYIETRRNEKFIDVMIARLAEFMDLVESGTEPTGKWIDGSEATKKALQKVHPLDNGETCVLPLESAEWHSDLTRLKEEIYQREKEKERLSNILRQQIGDNSYGLLPDGSRYNWKHQDGRTTCSGEPDHIVKVGEPFRVLRKCK
jgi:putative phage-type endonuclease